MLNISFVFLIRVVSLLQNTISDLELHILLLNCTEDFEATTLLVDVESVPFLLVGVCQLSVLVTVRSVKLCTRAFLNEDETTCACLHEDTRASLMHSCMVAKEAFIVVLFRMPSARAVLNFEPAHGLATEKASDTILLLFVTVAALFLVVKGLELKITTGYLNKIKLKVRGP